jgi:ribosomal-protein-alanine N-acetyltransferase
MTLDDLDQVMEIEQVAFAAPWPAQSYRHEITQNEHSTLLVVRSVPQPTRRLAQWLPRLRLTKRGPVLGYGGFWLLVDDAHIATIAVKPAWQGRGLGELVLLSLLDRAIGLGARRATLEVRVSNQAAQGLYQKLGFQIVSLRRRYYADNNEDAYIMATPSFDSSDLLANLSRCRAQLEVRLSRSDPDPASQVVEPRTMDRLDKMPRMR